ncbi:hypothetical protein [Rhizobium sp. AG855]|uniref:hypothetical protein n=1 Tax=Rhizobium sp. AG855 TaxID=2183898 RepID=UPI000E75ED1D|nr:hypothetical protein [Rhizobium sp. AG855]RKE83664.1 hypothetical protein DFO46_0417 [Rhizobium sp. AG855]
MSDEIAVQRLAEFAMRYAGIRLQSTSANVVYYSGHLYNVDGSTDDPKINGASWKGLLQANGIDGNCYVTHPLPNPGTSHPQFSVGGHMTQNADGSVEKGKTCYLMPLCSWHNSTSNNGNAFQHTETKMLELYGYMEGDLAATFLARMPGDQALRIVGADANTLTVQSTDMDKLVDAMAAGVREGLPISVPPHYLVFRQVSDAGRTTYVIEAASLP